MKLIDKLMKSRKGDLIDQIRRAAELEKLVAMNKNKEKLIN